MASDTCFGDYSPSDPDCIGCLLKTHCIEVQQDLRLDERYCKEMEEWLAREEVKWDARFGREQGDEACL